jgi:hypothetical protein
MSNAEQPKNTAAMQRLREEIGLTEQQAAAEKVAVLNGMTIDDSRQYEERTRRSEGSQKNWRPWMASDSVCAARRQSKEAPMSKKKLKKLRGIVEKVIRPTLPSEPEKAQIEIEEADELYREIRVENALTDENGEKVRLKPGAKVDVVVKADTDGTTKKTD